MLSPQVLDLNVVVDQMGDMLRRLIGEDIRLVVEHRSDACWVRVDPSQMEQVLLNLVVNARDAMQGGGTLTIGTAIAEIDEAAARGGADLAVGAHVVLCVRDTGIGMSPDVQARAFDPFYTTKEPGRGTGLGLSTVYGIVKQSGGAVWLESASGQGTTVWIGLPRCPALAAADPAPAPPSHVARTGTVLVVEDESGGEAALEIVGDSHVPIDLVVTDVVMPRMGGREMAAKLLARRPATRFLFISGYPDDARAPHDFLGAAGAFLAKPFAPEQLIERVRELLHAEPAQG